MELEVGGEREGGRGRGSSREMVKQDALALGIGRGGSGSGSLKKKSSFLSQHTSTIVQLYKVQSWHSFQFQQVWILPVLYKCGYYRHETLFFVFFGNGSHFRAQSHDDSHIVVIGY